MKKIERRKKKEERRKKAESGEEKIVKWEREYVMMLYLDRGRKTPGVRRVGGW